MTIAPFNTDIKKLPDWGSDNHRYYNIGHADPDGAGPPEHELVLPADWQYTHTFRSNGHWFAELVSNHGG